MTPLYLRIDVCTYRGLRQGVPGILKTLRQAKVRATFFVTFGPDASGLAILKMFRPSFAGKMLRTNAPATYGWTTALYGTLLPSPLVGAGLPDIVRRIRDEGHEVGLHGWDHRRWQDRLPDYPWERLRDEFERMMEAYRRVLGSDPAGFAAPAWSVTGELLALEQSAGLAYASDVRGSHPFLPMLDGRPYGVPQLPVTLPTLDESLGRLTGQEFAAEIAQKANAAEGYACFTAHAESEGLAFQDVLESILRRLTRPVAPLREAPHDGLLPKEIIRGRIRGRPDEVCLQK